MVTWRVSSSALSFLSWCRRRRIFFPHLRMIASNATSDAMAVAPPLHPRLPNSNLKPVPLAADPRWRGSCTEAGSDPDTGSGVRLPFQCPCSRHRQWREAGAAAALSSGRCLPLHFRRVGDRREGLGVRRRRRILPLPRSARRGAPPARAPHAGSATAAMGSRSAPDRPPSFPPLATTRPGPSFPASLLGQPPVQLLAGARASSRSPPVSTCCF